MKHRGARDVLSSLLVSLCALRPVLAQDDRPGAVRERALVSLVEVPVTVIGRDGKPVGGLTAADFELEEDGRRQAITSVDVVDLARHPGTAQSSDLPPLARRHFLFLFDFTFATPNEIARSREAAARFVGGGLSPDDLAAVATLSAERGARLELTFTSDRGQIIQAIQGVGLPNPIDRQRDPLAFAFSLPGDPRLILQEGYTPKQNVDANSAQKIIAAIGQRVTDDYTVTRVQRHLSDMSRLAAALDLVRGRKTVLYFSEGFDSRLLFGSIAHEKSLEQTSADNDAMMSGASWTIDVDRRYANAPIERQLTGVTEVLRRSDCVVYPIDIAGLQESGDGALGRSGRGEDFLFALAQGTGGDVIRNGNDLGEQIARVVLRTSLIYVLSYRPATGSKDGTYHALRVRTRVKGARVSARAGYYEQRSFGALSPLQRRLAAADIIAHEIPVSEIAARVLAAAHPGEKGLEAVPVLVEVDGGSLLSGQKGNRLSAEIFAYASDTENGIRDFFAQTVNVDLAGNRERLERGGLKFSGQLALPAGEYRVRVLVRNSETGRMGLVIEPVRVPDFSQRRAYLAPPVFLEESDTALSIRSPSATHAALTAETALRDAAGESLVPAALPQMRAGIPARLALVAYNFGDPAGVPWKVNAQVLSGDGRPLGPGEVEVLGRSPADSAGKQVLLLAYATLGAIYYSVNRLEEAVLSWEQFERLGGADPSTLSRLARARAEMSLSRNQRLREIGDFVFSYDTALPPELVERAAESLGAAARDLSRFFGASLPGRQSVILYEGRRYFALVSVPEWVSGAFDGKIRVTVDPEGGIAPELPMVLAHELAHAFVRRVSRDRAPGWLHEGLAQWWEGKRMLPQELRAALAGRTLSTLSEIEGNISRKPDRAAIRDAYVEALGLVEYLMLARGPGAVACLVRDLGEGAVPEEALRAETGLSEAELLAACRSWAGLDQR